MYLALRVVRRISGTVKVSRGRSVCNLDYVCQYTTCGRRASPERMMLMRYFLSIVVLALCSGVHADLPSAPLPDGIGVNIHFTDPRPGEMEMLAAAGFKWV